MNDRSFLVWLPLIIGGVVVALCAIVFQFAQIAINADYSARIEALEKKAEERK